VLPRSERGGMHVACRARKAGVPFTKEENCFTSSAPGLDGIAETLRTRSAVGRLRRVCERWSGARNSGETSHASRP
jgi:hypothetical protein